MLQWTLGCICIHVFWICVFVYMPTYDCYILLLSWSRKVMLSQRSHHSCCPLSSVWEKRVPVGQNSEKEEWERQKLQRFLPQSSATGASILDFLSRFWCLCHHDHHHWNNLWMRFSLRQCKKKKKKHFLLYILPQRYFLSQAAGQKGKVSLRILAVRAPLCSFAMWLSGLKSRWKRYGERLLNLALL